MRIIRIVLILGCVWVWPPAGSLAQGARAVEVEDLLKHANSFDGQNVIVRGEVIGNVMQRGNFAWVNIEDQTGAVGVWVPVEMAKKIASSGRYNIKGDYVEVEGEFARSHPALSGDLGILGQRLTVLIPGHKLFYDFNPMHVEIAAVLLLAVLSLLAIRMMIKRRWRAGQ